MPADGNQPKGTGKKKYKFEPFAAVEGILEGRLTLPARRVLNAGFCAWLLAPRDQNFINGYLMMRTALSIHDATKVERRKLPANRAARLLAELQIRISPENRPLFTDFFYPLGGLRGLAYADSPTQYQSSLSLLGARATKTAELAGIWHFHKECWGERHSVFGSPSVKKACEIYGAMEGEVGNNVLRSLLERGKRFSLVDIRRITNTCPDEGQHQGDIS